MARENRTIFKPCNWANGVTLKRLHQYQLELQLNQEAFERGKAIVETVVRGMKTGTAA